MIEGVEIFPLKTIPDERGKVMHMLKSTDPHFEAFGEIYFSCVYPGVVKGWHKHSKMTINYAVPTGKIKLVLYDDRADSPTKGAVQELFLGESNKSQSCKSAQGQADSAAGTPGQIRDPNN